MELGDLLETLNSAGVELSYRDEKLKVSAPPGVLTPELSEAIRHHKPSLLRLLAQATPDRGAVAAVAAIPRVIDRTDYDLTPEQRRNYQAALRGPGLATALDIRGALDVACLTAVLDAIVRRQSVLRSVFIDDGTAVKARVVPFQPVDLPCSPLPDQEDLIGTRLADEAQGRFDLNKGPLYRFRLFQVNPGRHILLSLFSQLVFDGFSVELFRGELISGYGALIDGREPPWEPLAVEFVDYAVWRKTALLDRDGQRGWWSQFLGQTVPGGAVPTDNPRPLQPAYRGRTLPFQIPSAILTALRALARNRGATLQMVLLAVLCLFVHRISNRPDVWIAVPALGRGFEVLEPVAGTFAKTLLLRFDVNPTEPFSALLEQVKDRSLQALEHQDFPLEEVPLRILPGEGTGRPPLYQVEFNFQQGAARLPSAAGLEFRPLEVFPGTAPQELSFQIEDRGDSVAGSLEFDEALFRDETLEHWCGGYLRLLGEVSRGDGTPAGSLSLVDLGDPILRQATETALRHRPLWASPFVSLEPQQVRIADSQGESLPLGVWGTLQLGSRTVPGRTRLRSDGAWERWKGLKRRRRPSDRRTSVVDPIEARVVDLFADALGVEEVGLQDSFFDLGGHSIMGVKLLNGVKKAFRVEFALGVLFEAPSPYLLSKQIRQANCQPDPDSVHRGGTCLDSLGTVVPIQPLGSRTPLFVAAGMGGNPLNLRYLSKALGQDQPFYGLQHRGTDGRQAPLTSVADAAREHADDIVNIQGKGPFLLGGFSAGGTVIFEVARELVRRGHRVSLLVMFDSISPTAERGPSSATEALQKGWKARGWRFLWEGSWRRITNLWGRAEIHLGSFLARFDRFRFRIQAVQAAWIAAAARYTPTPLEVDVVVFRSAVRDNGVDEPANGWNGLVQGKLTVLEVPGNHLTHLEPPHVAHVAAELQKQLEILL